MRKKFDGVKPRPKLVIESSAIWHVLTGDIDDYCHPKTQAYIETSSRC